MEKRDNGLDLLRIISTIMVILIHVNAQYFQNALDKNSVEYSIESIFNLITRFSVPCFVMISGAFNIREKNINICEYYLKVFRNIFFPFIVIAILFVLLMEFAAWYRKGSPYFYTTPIINFINGKLLNYWFMYMLFGLYILTPLIIRVKMSLSVRTREIVVSVWIVIACISQLTTEYKLPYSMGVIFSYLGYYMLGDLLYESRKKIKINHCWLIFFIMLLLLLTISIEKLGWENYMLNPYSSFFFPTIIIVSVLIFLGFINMCTCINLSKLAGYTYYIYLFHTVVYYVIFTFLHGRIYVNEIFTICIVTVLTFCIALIGSISFQKIWNVLFRIVSYKTKEKDESGAYLSGEENGEAK